MLDDYDIQYIQGMSIYGQKDCREKTGIGRAENVLDPLRIRAPEGSRCGGKARRQARRLHRSPGYCRLAEGERIFEVSAAGTNWLARQVTKAELKELKAKSRRAKDPITREFYAALLEG